MSRKPPLPQRLIAWICQRIWPSEWAMRVLHTHPDERRWLWRRESDPENGPKPDPAPDVGAVTAALRERIRRLAYWEVSDTVEQLRTRLACIGAACVDDAEDRPIGLKQAQRFAGYLSEIRTALGPDADPMTFDELPKAVRAALFFHGRWHESLVDRARHR